MYVTWGFCNDNREEVTFMLGLGVWAGILRGDVTEDIGKEIDMKAKEYVQRMAE
jgi:hypothetical protein